MALMRICDTTHHGEPAAEVKRTLLLVGALASKGRRLSASIEPATCNAHIRNMTILGRHKKYLVVSASLLTRP